MCSSSKKEGEGNLCFGCRDSLSCLLSDKMYRTLLHNKRRSHLPDKSQLLTEELVKKTSYFFFHSISSSHSETVKKRRREGKKNVLISIGLLS